MGEGNSWDGGLWWADGGPGQSFAESPPSRLSAKRQFSLNCILKITKKFKKSKLKMTLVMLYITYRKVFVVNYKF
jgi:hypothetical protein